MLTAGITDKSHGLNEHRNEGSSSRGSVAVMFPLSTAAGAASVTMEDAKNSLTEFYPSPSAIVFINNI